MRYLISILFVLSCALIFSPTMSLADRVTIEVPDVVENGDFVPVRVSLDKPLASNEMLTLLANGEIAALVTADSRVGLIGFETRVRLLSTDSKVSATMRVDKLLVAFWDKELKVIQPGQIPENEYNQDHNLHIRSREHDISLLISMKTSRADYVRGVKIETDRGPILINATPYISSFPSFKFQSENQFNTVSKAEVYWW